MASTAWYEGRATVQVMAGGKRRSIRLGRVGKNQARAFEVNVQNLATLQSTGEPITPDLASWLNGLSDTIHDRVARAGLVKPRVSFTLGELLSAWTMQKTAGVKGSTLARYNSAQNHLLAYFGNDFDVRQVTEQHARAFRAWCIKDQHLAADSTVAKTIGICRQFFTYAIHVDAIQQNPFQGMTTAVKANRSKQFNVTTEMAKAILAQCPDASWRLLFGLARWGGLRIPSETRKLRWADVIWDRSRFWVHSPKTEHHEDQDGRFVPIFPELATLFHDAFEQADPGAEFVLPDPLRLHTNPGVQLKRIIKSAGVRAYPKAWQNLRSTRQTELMLEYPPRAVCDWIGNSPTVAMNHYLQTPDELFTKASSSAPPETAEKAVQKAVQNPVQTPPATAGNDQPTKNALAPDSLENKAFCDDLRPDAQVCDTAKMSFSGPYRT